MPDLSITPPTVAAQPTSLAEVLQQVAALFRTAGLESPALDARLLVTATLGLDAADGFRRPELAVPPDLVARIDGFARRRLAREPVSRILGLRQFYGLDLEIGPATLDPRPETETLVEAVLELVGSGVVPGLNAPRILDLGTGSGALVIALLRTLSAARAMATDIDAEALAVAGRNAQKHGVAERVQWITARWLDGLIGPFDIIVSNPPYIPGASIDGLDAEVARYDPRSALDGGQDGLDAYRRIIPAAADCLASGGWLALEIGQGQEKDVSEIASDTRKFVCKPPQRQWRDLAGVTRCVAFQVRSCGVQKKAWIPCAIAIPFD